jgi:hypothetical protein
VTPPTTPEKPLIFSQVVALTLRLHATIAVLGKNSPEADRVRDQIGKHPERLGHVERLRLAELNSWLERFVDSAGLGG